MRSNKINTFWLKRIFLFLSIFFISSSWSESKITPDDLPPWLKPELLVHIAAMKMDENQNVEFREGLKDCIAGLQSVVQKEIRKGGVNIPKRIEKGIKRQYNKLDDRMRENLRPSQIEPWELYLEGLKEVMSQGSFKRSSENKTTEPLNKEIRNAALAVYEYK